MAFTGTPLVQLVSDSMVRVTGVSLAAGAAGVISLSGGAAAVKCPHAFQPTPYVNAKGETVALDESIQVTVEAAATGVATAVPIAVVKTGTLAPDVWNVTITNTHGSLATPVLEIYLKFHN